MKWLLPALIALGAAGAAQAADPELGVPASPSLVKARDIGIAPDGSGLPPGSGTVAHPIRGEVRGLPWTGWIRRTRGPPDRRSRFARLLTSSHPVKTVASYWPYATTLFDYIQRAMPIPRPESLSNDEVYALCAYLLAVDHIVTADTTLNATTLPKARMPNRNGFVSLWPPQPR